VDLLFEFPYRQGFLFFHHHSYLFTSEHRLQQDIDRYSMDADVELGEVYFGLSFVASVFVAKKNPAKRLKLT